jgi:hypothetical protein
MAVLQVNIARRRAMNKLVPCTLINESLSEVSLNAFFLQNEYFL